MLNYIDFRTFVPLVVSAVLGALIGLEREIHGKPAGLRTNILICVGAATFMIIASRMSASPDAISRMTAGIVTGVGFIGGAVVLRDRNNIYGVTTAATIWVVTSVGIACGRELYDVAIAVTLVSLLVLIVLNPLDRRIHRPKQNQEE